MPVNNKRSYGSSSNSSSRRSSRDEAPARSSSRKPAGRSNSGGKGKGAGFKKDNFNMLNFGMGFADILEEDRGLPTKMKCRILLKADKETKDLIDVADEHDNEYSPEEAAQLLAKALLEGRGINLYLFLNDDDSYGGNARIDIKGIELEDEADEDDDEEEEEEVVVVPKRKPAAKKTTSGKPSTKTSPTKAKARDYEADIRKQAQVDEDEEDEVIEEEVLDNEENI